MHIGLGSVNRMLLMITETEFVDESIVLNESQIADIQKYLDFYNIVSSTLYMSRLRLSIGCNVNVVRIFALLAEICAIATSKTIDV